MVAPIICEGDAIGAVALMSREPRAKFGDMETKLALTQPGFWDARWKAKGLYNHDRQGDSRYRNICV